MHCESMIEEKIFVVTPRYKTKLERNIIEAK